MNSLQTIVRNLNNLRPFTKYRAILSHYSTDIYEPDYLDALKPKVPLYEVLDIEMRGYDYPILENYQKLVHNLAKNMDINVEDAWALPHQNINVSTYKPLSEIVDSQYKLKVFRRTVQITDVPNTQVPLLLRAIEASTPAGVTVNVVHHTEHHDEERYVPDQELKTLKQSLDNLGGAAKKK